MGYLSNSTIVVDAILTKKGREILASGRGNFKVTKFALSDDEVDYTLWNPAHPNGSDYYGIIIENMPLLEALPDENASMKHKLITLPKGTTLLPTLKVLYATDDEIGDVTPSTTGGLTEDYYFEYTAKNVTPTSKNGLVERVSGNMWRGIIKSGEKLRVTNKDQDNDVTFSIVVRGLISGISKTITLTLTDE